MGPGPRHRLVRQAGGLHPLRDGPLPWGRDSDHVNTVGEPYSGKPNVRFDEGRLDGPEPGPAAYSTESPMWRPSVRPSQLRGGAPRLERGGADAGAEIGGN